MKISNETCGVSWEGLVAGGKPQKKDSSNRGTSRWNSKYKNLICGYYKKKAHIKGDYFKLKNKE